MFGGETGHRVTGFVVQSLDMTTTPSPQTTDIDPREILAEALRVGDTVVRSVRPEHLKNPTPCTDYDVRGLLDHVVGAVCHVAVVGAGDAPSAETECAEAGDDWAGAWAGAAAAVRAAWADPAKLARTFDLGWATMTGAAALTAYTSEVVVHTWDLARATGQHPVWDDRLVQTAFDALRAVLPDEGRTEMFDQFRRNAPPEMTDFSDPFAPAVEVSPDAPLIDQLVAWSGRRP
jgi:uncharacterized protein (TIGR03086 family)